MLVVVVHVRHMRMLVPEPAVAVPVGMRLAGRIVGCVAVPMMLVVDMRMCMLHGLMHVLMIVRFGDVQPHTGAHQQARRSQLQGQRLMQECDCRHRSHKRRRRKIGARARGAEIPQRQDEKHEADPIAGEPDQACERRRRRARKRLADRDRKGKIERAGNQSLQFDDLQGIGKGDLARQIVVETPGDTCADNASGPARPCQLGRPVQASTRAPATRQAMPNAMRRSKFS